jgi:hypothetical protein
VRDTTKGSSVVSLETWKVECRVLEFGEVTSA